jgi:hypothetical protein
MPLAVRTIKKVSDGSIKRVKEGVADRMVAQGKYIYEDDGPDNSQFVRPIRSLNTLTNKPTQAISLRNLPIEKLDPPIQQIRAKTPPKTIKVSSVPEDKMEAIKKINQANPAMASTSENAMVNNLDSLVERAKAKRKTQTKIPIVVPEE